MMLPKFWYTLGTKESDLKWLTSRIREIPESEQKEACRRYDNLFLSSRGGRKKANTFIDGLAREHRANRLNKQNGKQ